MTIFLWFLFIVAGFFSGSVLYCRLIPKALTHRDICEIADDKNPGAFNVFTHFGIPMGILCLFCDIMKGFVPVLLASLFMDTTNLLFSIVMIAPALGHAVGIFDKFHGGKAIAVSFGITAGILPVSFVAFPLLAVLFVLFSTAVRMKPNRVRSIAVYALFGVLSGVLCALIDGASVAIGCVCISLIALFKHIFSKENGPIQ